MAALQPGHHPSYVPRVLGSPTSTTQRKTVLHAEPPLAFIEAPPSKQNVSAMVKDVAPNDGRKKTSSLRPFVALAIGVSVVLLLCGSVAAGILFIRSRRTQLLFLRRHKRGRESLEPAALAADFANDAEGTEELIWVQGLGWTTKRSSQPVNLADAAVPLAEPEVETSVLKEPKPAEKSASEWGPLSDLIPESVLQAKEIGSMQQSAFDLALRFRESSRKYLSRTGGEEAIRVRVTGQKSIVKRDLPLIEKGYSLAFLGPQQWAFKQQISEPDGVRDRFIDEGSDLVLCLSLSTCSRKDDVFSSLFEANPGARVNRVPNLRGVLWSKQNLCRNIPAWLAAMVSFSCWILPEQEHELLDSAKGRASNFQWIAKPWSGGGGNGITLVTGFEELRDLTSARKNLVVQPFLSRPLVVNARKVDLRVYVLLTSTYPLRAYVHQRGLVRFASSEYKETSLSSDRGQFLTNTSVNKKESNATAAELTWPFSNLYEVLGAARARRTRLGTDRAIAAVLLAAESHFPKRTGCETDGACYHLLGFDVILSASERESPRVIEVNGEPSFAMAATSTTAGNADGSIVEHYQETKLTVARDIARVVFGPMSDKALLNAKLLLAHVEDARFAQYVLELCREQSATDVEFRPVYPSAVAAFYPQQDEQVFARLLERDVDRLRLHAALNGWTRTQLLNCHENALQCVGPARAILDDLLGDGLIVRSASSGEPDDDSGESPSPELEGMNIAN